MILSDLRQDLLYGARSLKGAPGFFVVAVLTVGLGIGASTAVFSVVDALLLRPLPFHEPQRLVRVALTAGDGGLSSVTFRTSNLRDWRRRCRSFESLTGYFAFFDFGSNTLTGDGEAERVVGVPVAQNFLDVLGVRLHLGRNFVDEEGVQNGRRALILSHRFWQGRYGGDPNIVGRPITLNGEPTIGSFALTALLLAALGIYGVVSYSVSRRTQEIGIRMALGESPAEVRRRFVRKSLRLAAMGVLVGTLGSLALSRLVSSLLFGIGPTDPTTYGLMVLALTLTAAVAAYLPARRASRTNPARVLSSA